MNPKDIGRIMKFGKQPVSLSLVGYWNLEKPQFVIKFLFPK